MEENQIAGRIANFLAQYPPFHMLDADKRRELAAKARVTYAPVGTILFKQNEAAGTHFYMVAQGSVKLTAQQGEAQVLIDMCDEGDVFGIRPMLVKGNYIASAEVVEESILYAFPWQTFEPWLHDVPGLALFFAAGFASGLPVVREQLEAGEQLQGGMAVRQLASDAARLTSPVPHRTALTCSPETQVMLAATMMRDARADYMLVAGESQQPLGIITDTDLRNHIATGQFPVETPVQAIMHQPVYCVKAGCNFGELQLDMLERNLHHLVVTSDGSAHGAIVGVITEHDLLAAEGSSAAALQQAILLANKPEQLIAVRERLNDLIRSLLQRGIETAWLGSLVSRIQDMISQRVIQLVQEQMRSERQALPAVPFAWLMLGSGGRREQLLPTDQDHALVFADGSPADVELWRKSFLQFSRRVSEALQAMGFAPCPAQMMSSNPRWCLSISEWQAQFSKWIEEPDPKAVMMTTIFFDFRRVFGDEQLTEQLRKHLADTLPKANLYISALAKNACQNPPPLSFFRQFIVEKDGEHRQRFDIKARAMMPLADAARVLWLQAGLPEANSTIDRFEALANREPAQAALFREAARAYELLMRYRASAAANDEPLDPANLSKIDRQLLRSSFQPIHELQELLEVRFQTAWLR